MQFTLLASFAAVAALAFAAPSTPTTDTKSLPLCTMDDRPCRCPSGTTFKNLTSFGIIGSTAKDVQSIMGPFFNIQFMSGLTPFKTSGKEGVAGATRTFNLAGPSGNYNITEVLTKFTTKPDGSFVQGYEQATTPAVVNVPGGGSYHGEWVLIVAEQTVIANETAIAWKNWRCEVGDTFPAAEGHENGITNTSAILKTQGKHTGVDVDAFTIFYTLRND